jgi:signal peptide peptidase SppA
MPEPYRRTADGVGIITQVGEFVNRGAWVGARSGLISYEGTNFSLQRAAADPKVQQILVDQETPGGEAVGAFEAAALMRQVAAEKPVTVIVNGMSASAGYALGSGASRIITIPTGLVGSIGVVMLHLDFSQFLKGEGIKPTFIFAGDHKVDGNPYEPLSKAAATEFQSEVDSVYDQFIETVVAGRKNLTDKQARGTQARVFKGQEAVDAGLADDVGTFEQVLDELSSRSNARSRASAKGTVMNPATGPAPGAETGITQAQLDAAVTAARAEGQTAGEKAGADAVYTRLAAIFGDAKVKGKEATAFDLASKSRDMKAEDVVGFVASLPAGTKSIEQRMAGQGGALALGGPIEQPKAEGSAGWAKAIAKLPGAKKTAA